MKKLLFIFYFLSFSSYLKAQNNYVTISQAYGSRSQRTHFAVTNKQVGTDYITTYKFGNYTITADNNKSENYILINIKTPGILGANDNITIPYTNCNGYVLYKGGVANILGSSKLEYLVSFRSVDKKFVAINQIMDTETDRYHYSIEPLNQQLYMLSKKIWTNCNITPTATQNNTVNSPQNRLSFTSLRTLEGKDGSKAKFFDNPIVKQELLRIMQTDYNKFKKDFITNCRIWNIEVTKMYCT